MGEKYVGRKFRTEFKSEQLPEDTRMYELMELGKRFRKLGLLPAENGGHAGNMSFRNNRGFVITAGGADKGKLNPKHFVQVLKCNMDIEKVIAEGEMQPSSETFTHYLIYRERKDISAVIHVHDMDVMKKAKQLKLTETRKVHPYGTVQLAYEIEKTIGHRRYIVVRGHGAIAMGKSIWEAGNVIETYHQMALKA